MKGGFKVIIVFLPGMVILTGYWTVTTTHEITDLSLTGDSVRVVPTIDKTYRDLASLCPHRDSPFWHLPLNEQNLIANLIFSNIQNIDHIQYIGLIHADRPKSDVWDEFLQQHAKQNIQDGKPCGIEVLLYERCEVDGLVGYNTYRLYFLKKRKEKWFLLSKHIINVSADIEEPVESSWVGMQGTPGQPLK